MRIVADQQLRIAGTWPVTPSRVDVRYELAWRERQLMFRFGDTLADAVEEFNLRNRVQLRLDPSAAALPVRGRKLDPGHGQQGEHEAGGPDPQRLVGRQEEQGGAR